MPGILDMVKPGMISSKRIMGCFLILFLLSGCERGETVDGHVVLLLLKGFGASDSKPRNTWVTKGKDIKPFVGQWIGQSTSGLSIKVTVEKDGSMKPWYGGALEETTPPGEGGIPGAVMFSLRAPRGYGYVVLTARP